MCVWGGGGGIIPPKEKCIWGGTVYSATAINEAYDIIMCSLESQTFTCTLTLFLLQGPRVKLMNAVSNIASKLFLLWLNGSISAVIRNTLDQ